MNTESLSNRMKMPRFISSLDIWDTAYDENGSCILTMRDHDDLFRKSEALLTLMRWVNSHGKTSVETWDAWHELDSQIYSITIAFNDEVGNKRDYIKNVLGFSI